MKLFFLAILVGTLLAAYLLTKVLKGVFQVVASLVSLAVIFIVVIGGLTYFDVVQADDFSEIPVLSTVTGQVTAWKEDPGAEQEKLEETFEETAKNLGEEIEEQLNNLTRSEERRVGKEC